MLAQSSGQMELNSRGRGVAMESTLGVLPPSLIGEGCSQCIWRFRLPWSRRRPLASRENSQARKCKWWHRWPVGSGVGTQVGNGNDYCWCECGRWEEDSICTPFVWRSQKPPPLFAVDRGRLCPNPIETLRSSLSEPR